MIKIQIVIPAINLWENYSKPCIDSIKTKYDYRILFVDNGSTDQTKIEAGKLVSNVFAHQRNEETWSCAKTWNFAVKDAFARGFDYALVLNNDVLLHPETIDRLVDRFEESKRKLIAIPDKNLEMHAELTEVSMEAPMSKQVFESEILAMVTAMNVRGDCKEPKDIFTLDAKNYEIVNEAEHPDFSAFMISKEAYEKVGDFDEAFIPCYWEDNDYHTRITKSGLKALVIPSAIYYHYGSRTQVEALGGGRTVSTHETFNNNRAYFITKWGGLPNEERFDLPFNRKENTLKSTMQNGIVR